MLADLHKKYEGKKATIIMGGPSILKNNLNLSLLKKRSDVVFIEPKALTRKFYEFNLTPDFLFATFPEKLRTNTLQYTFLQAIANNYDLTLSLKDQFKDEWKDFVENFAEYAEIWRINFPHKRFKIKKKIILPNSPNDFLQKYPNLPIIAYKEALESDGFDQLGFNNQILNFDINQNVYFTDGNTVDYKKYLNPEIINNEVILNGTNSLNSALIGIVPVLNFLGFKQVCFIGKDMSMLGAMEYSAEYIFKSMRHYNKFFNSNRLVFSYGFPKGQRWGILSFLKHLYENIFIANESEKTHPHIIKRLVYDIWGLNGKFMRERNQFSDYEMISKHSSIKFINIYQPTKYASKVPGMKNITFEEFIKNH